MALFPSTLRLDLKCGNGAISPGEKCHKGSAQKVDPKASAPRPTVGLEKLPTKALKEQRNRLFDDLIKKYPTKIKTEEDYKKWRSWAAKQPENEEANAVGQILERRRKRGQRVLAGVALAGTAGALLTAGALSGRLRRDADGIACGQGHIARGKTCRKKGAFPTRKAIVAGLTAAAVGAGAFALSRRASAQGGGFSAPSTPTLSGAPTPRPPQLPGLTPKGLLKAAPKPKSKTQRMRENTGAAMRVAEGRIAQTAREEVRRIAQIGNTMAAAGEATGMAVKTGLREVRLRTEAARRRYEPGYRSPDQRRLPGGVQSQLPGASLNPERVAIPINPRTGQPQRKKARGFASRGDNYIPHYATTYIDPARQRGDACWEGYVQAGMKRKGKREVPNCIPASSGLAQPKAQRAKRK